MWSTVTVPAAFPGLSLLRFSTLPTLWQDGLQPAPGFVLLVLPLWSAEGTLCSSISAKLLGPAIWLHWAMCLSLSLVGEKVLWNLEGPTVP